jgi:hypothetical protein
MNDFELVLVVFALAAYYIALGTLVLKKMFVFWEWVDERRHGGRRQANLGFNEPVGPVEFLMGIGVMLTVGLALFVVALPILVVAVAFG